MQKTLLLFVFAVLFFSASVKADTVETFNISATFSDGEYFDPASTVSFDTTTGLAAGADMIIDSLGETYTGVPPGCNDCGSPFFDDYFWSGNEGGILLFDGATESLVGFTGGTITDSLQLSDAVSGGYVNNAGPVVLSPEVDPTPEPSSLLLLSNGLVGLGFMKRKVFKS